MVDYLSVRAGSLSTAMKVSDAENARPSEFDKIFQGGNAPKDKQSGHANDDANLFGSHEGGPKEPSNRDDNETARPNSHIFRVWSNSNCSIRRGGGHLPISGNRGQEVHDADRENITSELSALSLHLEGEVGGGDHSMQFAEGVGVVIEKEGKFYLVAASLERGASRLRRSVPVDIGEGFASYPSIKGEGPDRVSSPFSECDALHSNLGAWSDTVPSSRDFPSGVPTSKCVNVPSVSNASAIGGELSWYHV
ncbi:hypothetical protein SAMN05444413_107177 [Roseivivax marinus]|nr:hypothetical protein SAMN05444413_107177 [Roseivivax marinus]